jgi:hypothetical protein
MKILFSTLFVLLISLPVIAQDRVYGEKRERYKVWKNWKSKRQSYNPYLDRKGKDKPSSRMAREDKKYIKKSNREAKRQMRRSRKGLGKKRKH